MDMLLEAFKSGNFPKSLTADITLLPQSGKPSYSCEDMRPISLLNADRKILAK